MRQFSVGQSHSHALLTGRWNPGMPRFHLGDGSQFIHSVHCLVHWVPSSLVWPPKTWRPQQNHSNLECRTGAELMTPLMTTLVMYCAYAVYPTSSRFTEKFLSVVFQARYKMLISKYRHFPGFFSHLSKPAIIFTSGGAGGFQINSFFAVWENGF